MHTRSRTKPQSPNQIPDERNALVTPELLEVIELEDSSFASSLYHDLAPDSAIHGFLKKSRLYSLTERRWRIPQNYAKLFDGDTLSPIFNVISSIVKSFWADAAEQGHREVVDTHGTDLRHSKFDPQSHRSRPTFVIKAEGPSFQLPQGGSSEDQTNVGFSNVAGCIEFQAEGDVLPVHEQQLFIHQPNRRFVRVLYLSGHLLRLFHFDASGVQYTPLLDIHTEPYTLVRLVLGMSSPNEADIGLDTSIRWIIKDGRKISGTVTSRGEDDLELVYPLVDVDPFFSQSIIRGRCTKCWRVTHPISGEELIVKDSWKCDDWTSEDVFLRMARGIPGVVQMVACEPDRSQTQDLRSFKTEAPPSFQKRVETRVIVKLYGQPINKFTSAKELLYSLRDAIEGHRQLLKKGVLHRDIAIHNILKGRPGAEPGQRAVIIDLDMALLYTTDSVEPTDWRIGNSLYQPISALRGHGMAEPLVHDHLDDLESFFYVLAYIMHVYDSRGVFHSIPNTFRAWIEYGDNPDVLALLKQGFLVQSTISMEFSDRWPATYLVLFYDFRGFIEKVFRQKDVVINDRPADGRDELKRLRLRADEHYDYILGLFDRAISTLEKDEAAASPTALPPLVMSRSPLKRSSEDGPDGQPAAHPA
ncbi:hypothetical protein MD484_g6314, partial [Candolleomyces efflorescens]